MPAYEPMTLEKSSILLIGDAQVDASHLMRGILWFCASGVLSTAINSLIRLLSDEMGYHPFQLVFFYSLTGAMMYLPLMMREKGAFYTSYPKLYAMRSVLEVTGFTLTFFAITLIPFAMLTTMMFTVPLIGAVAAVFLLGEHMTPQKWLGLLLGFVGIVVVSQPDLQVAHWELLLPLFASLCFALCGVLIRKMALCTEPPKRIAFLTLSLMAVITLPLALQHWQTPTLSHLPYLMLLAIMAGAVQFCVGNALKYIKLTTAQPFMFLNLLWSAGLGWLLFEERVAWATILGAVFIFAGIIINVRGSSHKGEAV
jgi:drug/metabolite transporter (DMT)-like permease